MPQIHGILTCFGRDGVRTLTTDQVWLQSRNQRFRLPKSFTGVVGERVSADVQYYSTPIVTALHNPYVDRSIPLHGIAHNPIRS